MLNQIKNAIKSRLYNGCFEEYCADVAWQKDRYAAFLQEKGEAVRIRIPDALRDVWTAWEQNGDLSDTMQAKRGEECVVFVAKNGIAREDITQLFDGLFRQDAQMLAAYAHEDVITREGIRKDPWFKPAFSPDTLADSFYVGNVFAVRTACCMDRLETAAADSLPASEARTLFLEAVCRRLEQAEQTAESERQRDYRIEGAGLLPVIAFHQWQQQECNVLELALEQDNVLAIWLREHRLRTNSFTMEIYRLGVQRVLDKKKLVSVIIPSKDNPEVLKKCISSLRDKTQGIGYEIIVVDNGSTEANRACIEAMAEAASFQYVYEKQPFNFSRMCNLGADRARGAYLLFLNDDMEIIQEDWMVKLFEKAALAHVGAVGAKLLYPDTDLIQHAGVTNLAVGPAHKLLKESDSISYYHGRNRGVHNMLAVTAACLMVERRKFQKAGGFYEGIAVSYNDVDLCFSLYEQGFFNVQRNDVILYHHESLSRGDDNLSEEKWERLLREKELLYQRHPERKGKDPFYSEFLAGHFSDYICSFEYGYEKRDCYTAVRAFRGQEPLSWQNDCLTVNVEHARRERKLDIREEQEVYWIEGWSYVLGMDNCQYHRELLLLAADGKGYRAQLLTRYRADVEEILTQQSHVALAGFTCRIPVGRMRPGHYQICMLAKDRCSKQRLYRRTDTVLVVDS